MARKARPKTGEARKTHQPFAIDKLPLDWRDRLMTLRARRLLTWEQMEEETKNLDWAALEKTDPELVLSHFADHRIPKSTLHNWYDVRVEQVAEEAEAERLASLRIAESLTKNGYENLDQNVKDGLGDVIFTHIRSSGDPEKFAAALEGLALVLTRFKRTEIAKQRVELESKKLNEIISRAKKETDDAAKKISKGRAITLGDINRLRERTFGLPPVERKPAAGSAAVPVPAAVDRR